MKNGYPLNEYQYLLGKLQNLKLEYLEIRQKINNSGYPSIELSDMPRGGKSDAVEILLDLIDTELTILRRIDALQDLAQSAKHKLEKHINDIENPNRRLIIRLKYLNGLTTKEIIKETGKSYWSVIKYFNRY